MGLLHSAKEVDMISEHVNLPAKEIDQVVGHLPYTDVRPVDPAYLGNAELIRTIMQQVTDLAKVEAELASVEARADLLAELDAVRYMAFATVSGIIAINLMIMSLVLLFAPDMAWLACLILSLVLFATMGAFAYLGWKGRVKGPMIDTIDSLKETVDWLKERLR